MNERYLFRGKRTDNGEWVVGDLVNHRCGKVSINTNPPRYGYGATEGFATLVDPATVGQCTGLRDKNGVLIFEGDVVLSANKYSFSVRNGIWSFNQKNCAPAYHLGWCLNGIGSMDGENLAVYTIDGFMLRLPAHVTNTPEGIDELKVVIAGNIHDNPELLWEVVNG